jgi:hypothetical protein
MGEEEPLNLNPKLFNFPTWREEKQSGNLLGVLLISYYHSFAWREASNLQQKASGEWEISWREFGKRWWEASAFFVR